MSEVVSINNKPWLQYLEETYGAEVSVQTSGVRESVLVTLLSNSREVGKSITLDMITKNNEFLKRKMISP